MATFTDLFVSTVHKFASMHQSLPEQLIPHGTSHMATQTICKAVHCWNHKVWQHTCSDSMF